MPAKKRRRKEAAAAEDGGALARTAADSAAGAAPGKKKKKRRTSEAPAPVAAAAPSGAAAGTEGAAAPRAAKASKKKRKAAGGKGEVAAAAEPAAKKATVKTDAKAVGKDGGVAAVAKPADEKVRAKAKVAKREPRSEALAPPVKKKRKLKESAEGAADRAASAGKETATSSAQDADHTVFVDGVPYTWELTKIRELFTRCGEVVDVRAPTWQDSGRLRGYAHVSFASAKGRDEALKMNGILVGRGRFLKIEAAKRQGAGAADAPSAKELVGKRRLFVKNIPYDATEAELKELFGRSGAVVDIRVPTSFGRCKGFAYVEFAKAEALAKAVKSGAELRGRRLHLDADEGRGPKAGFHYRTSAFEVARAVSRGGGGRGAGGRGGGDRGRGGGGRGA